FVRNARELVAQLDRPLVMENIPGFFEVRTSQMPEPEWLRRFFDQTGTGFLLDLPHLWLQAHYRDLDRVAWLKEFPLEQVTEIHVAGVEGDNDLQGPWISPAEPPADMLDFREQALAWSPDVQAVAWDVFSPA